MMEMDHIYCMDCVEGIKQIPDSSIDLILTDPPYLIKETRAGGCSRLARTIQPVNNLIKENGLDLGISLGMSDYSLDLEAALGDLYLGGSRQYGAVHREDGENQLTVDSAVGDVSIYFDYGY